ncbi:hypothetical protein [Methylophilus sp. 5]|uniref:glycoside hydrolase family 17 protein n=1 Tax=Methylophilus sp. 5 TaxID=1112274 RepID=UPI00048D23D5|nr:hypothetical protein [Methylophilus sp. 5]
MLQRLLSRISPIVWLTLFLLGSMFYVWRLQQPQALVEVAAEALPLQCVSYAPYYKPGMNPTIKDSFVDPLQIEQDLQALSKVTRCVRTYSVGQGLDYVPKAAQKLGMKVIVGVWIGWVDALNKAELQLAVQQANQYPDTVRGLVVGNEVLLRGEQTEPKMHEYLQWAKANTKAPVTYADVWEFWLKHPTLEQDVDFVTVHILPYWEDKPVAIEQAVAHTASVMGHLGTVFKKPILIGETGWPSQGRQRFWSKPGAINQARYMREFLQAAQVNHWQYNVIEAVDQPWKRELEGTVGGFWGVLNTDLQAKFNLQGPVAERTDGFKPYVLALVLAVAAAAWGQYKRVPVNQMVLLALTGGVVGLHAYLQVGYVQLAARNSGEYAMLGGLVLLGWALVLLQLRPWLGLVAKPCIEQSLLRLLALAFLLTSAGLAIQGRYLDFPLILVCLPLVMITIAIITAPVREAAQAAIHAIGIWLTAVMVLIAANMAIAVAMTEPGNVMAWWWCAACGLALFVLPAKSVQLSQ